MNVHQLPPLVGIGILTLRVHLHHNFRAEEELRRNPIPA